MSVKHWAAKAGRLQDCIWGRRSAEFGDPNWAKRAMALASELEFYTAAAKSMVGAGEATPVPAFIAERERPRDRAVVACGAALLAAAGLRVSIGFRGPSLAAAGRRPGLTLTSAGTLTGPVSRLVSSPGRESGGPSLWDISETLDLFCASALRILGELGPKSGGQAGPPWKPEEAAAAAAMGLLRSPEYAEAKRAWDAEVALGAEDW